MLGRAIVLLLLSVSVLLAAAANQTITSRIPRTYVESSAIASVGYTKHQHALEIEFRNGAIHRHVDVPTSTYRDLMAAPSKAGYYDNHVRYRFHSIRVKARR